MQGWRATRASPTVLVECHEVAIRDGIVQCAPLGAEHGRRDGKPRGLHVVAYALPPAAFIISPVSAPLAVG